MASYVEKKIMTRFLIWNGVAVFLFLAIWGAVHVSNSLPSSILMQTGYGEACEGLVPGGF
jgi:hypothetical protein